MNVHEGEREYFRRSILHLTHFTQTTYMSAYDSLVTYIDPPMKGVDPQLAVALINDLPNPHTRYRDLNVLILLNKMYNEIAHPLIEYRYELRDQVAQHTVERNRRKNAELPPLTTLWEHLETLEDPVAYVAVFLTLTLVCRSQDIMFTITDGEESDTSKNYLLRRPGYVEFVRNVYKTSRSYHSKRDIITDCKFLNMVHLLPEGPFRTQLRKHTYGALNEGDYCKIQVKDAMEGGGGLQRLKRISMLRGTNVETLIDSYDLAN